MIVLLFDRYRPPKQALKLYLLKVAACSKYLFPSRFVRKRTSASTSSREEKSFKLLRAYRNVGSL